MAEELHLRCPYCKGIGTLQPGDRVWPGKSLPSLYVCENHPACNTYVRCHSGSDKPLGTLAGERLRRLRKLAHGVFDPIWKDSGNELGRSAAYNAAAAVMGVEGEFHIGNLNEEECEHFIANISFVELAMDAQMHEHLMRGAPPSEMTIEILHSLFHPDQDTYLPDIALQQIVTYESAWTESQRCGLIIQDQFKVRLSPKGVGLVYDPIG